MDLPDVPTVPNVPNVPDLVKVLPANEKLYNRQDLYNAMMVRIKTMNVIDLGIIRNLYGFKMYQPKFMVDDTNVSDLNPEILAQVDYKQEWCIQKLILLLGTSCKLRGVWPWLMAQNVEYIAVQVLGLNHLKSTLQYCNWPWFVDYLFKEKYTQVPGTFRAFEYWTNSKAPLLVNNNSSLISRTSTLWCQAVQRTILCTCPARLWDDADESVANLNLYKLTGLSFEQVSQHDITRLGAVSKVSLYNTLRASLGTCLDYYSFCKLYFGAIDKMEYILNP